MLNKLTIRAMDHAVSVHFLYQKFGTLSKVSRKLRLSRQRIEQILNYGRRLGVIAYTPRRLRPEPTRQAILKASESCKTQEECIDKLGMSRRTLHRLLGERGRYLLGLMLKKQRRSSVELRKITEYCRMVENLGRHPTSYEIQRSRFAAIRSVFEIGKLRKILGLKSTKNGRRVYVTGTINTVELMRRYLNLLNL